VVAAVPDAMSEAPRVPGLERDQWSDEVRGLLLATLGPVAELEARGEGEGEEPRPLAILTVLAHAPRLLGPFLGWASALALEGALPRRDHELLALRTAVNCTSEFEWGHHVTYARAARLSDNEIARVASGPDALGWTTEDATLLRAADELALGTTISDPTWVALKARYEPRQLVEIPLVVGQYTMLSMVANALGVELEPGHEPLPVVRRALT
jgi:4-carboxymuconolactone decarboxylase